ncbi:MAG: D-tyrosyl-tRNA(Tyr) deacylase [Candidatus Obscuribacterales bacterium]|nr:D-tyrosyl-tRNA(Tyr) deacylase [Candidatus Obscuribacterales bacterium]
MKAVLQRVSSASVTVDGQCVGKIEKGLVILLGVETGDCDSDSTYLAQKAVELRIFPDADNKMNLSLADAGGQALIVSQFTLIADWKKGRRPGFSRAARPEEGNRLYEHFIAAVRQQGIHVETGIFGADMDVALVNDGPVTLILETEPVKAS